MVAYINRQRGGGDSEQTDPLELRSSVVPWSDPCPGVLNTGADLLSRETSVRRGGASPVSGGTDLGPLLGRGSVRVVEERLVREFFFSARHGRVSGRRRVSAHLAA